MKASSASTPRLSDFGLKVSPVAFESLAYAIFTEFLPHHQTLDDLDVGDPHNRLSSWAECNLSRKKKRDHTGVYTL